MGSVLDRDFGRRPDRTDCVKIWCAKVSVEYGANTHEWHYLFLFPPNGHDVLEAMSESYFFKTQEPRYYDIMRGWFERHDERWNRYVIVDEVPVCVKVPQPWGRKHLWNASSGAMDFKDLTITQRVPQTFIHPPRQHEYREELSLVHLDGVVNVEGKSKTFATAFLEGILRLLSR